MSRTWSNAMTAALRGSDTPQLATFGVLLAAAAGLYWGWQVHWFLTDDAFIAFRFIDNRGLGFGYAWNPPPFLAVEGYTSFAWVVLLDVIWSVFDVAPPDAANNLSLACSAGSLAVATWASAALCRVRGISRPAAVGVTAAVLFATVSQPTFLIWASSGLETALYNLLLQCWVLFGALRATGRPIRVRDLAIWCALASFFALARPEGLLAAAASLAFVLTCVASRAIDGRRALAAVSPLAIVAAHLAWRRATYGEWLPNTYYAKVVAAWPEAGLRYGAAFSLEYAYYLAAPFWVFGAWFWARGNRQRVAAAISGEARRREILTGIRQLLSLGLPLVLLGFLLLVAGGDHFEYRALSFLCPLTPLAFAYGCLALRPRAALAALALLAYSGVAAVLPWTVFAKHRDQYSWPAAPPVEPIAADVPAVFGPIAERFDALERWLLPHGVGIRHYEHRAFWLQQIRSYPSRDDAARACARADHPIAVLTTIGVGGWTLSGCAVIDTLGLADYFIARTPGKLGYLGHDRKPPIEYLRAFQPNVVFRGHGVFIRPRPRPLTDDDIRAVEQHYRALVAPGE